VKSRESLASHHVYTPAREAPSYFDKLEHVVVGFDIPRGCAIVATVIVRVLHGDLVRESNVKNLCPFDCSEDGVLEVVLLGHFHDDFPCPEV
jgi:hypothetical protein